MERYKMLVAKDEISRQQYDQAVAAAEAARATLDAQRAVVVETQQNISVAEMAVDQARAKVAQAEASVESAMTGPQQVKVSESRVQSAAAKVEQQKAQLAQAELNLKYATIVAPVSGIIGKKAVAVGQNVSVGQQLMAIVPLDDLWVTANFKETQLRSMKPGQAVKIKVDAFDREYSGRVERIAGASGAKFSLLPPENATGNYVKVVQRIPVRIALDAGQNRDRILRPGMSVVPSVRIR
jgi:membrane fusion protein (multidrug efflux system)